MNEGLKRGYFVHIKDEGTGEAVIATSSQEAKKLAWPALCLDGEWTDLRARVVAGNEQVSDLPVGRMKDMNLALKRGLYSAIDGVCEMCKEEGQVIYCRDKIVCHGCEDEMEGLK